MRTIKVRQLELKNFKKIKDLTIKFNENETSILGKNGSGKTTVFDAYNWLLFNKNSRNQTVFEIKTLNSDSTTIHNLNHSVKALFLIDDSEEVSLQKIYKEKWTKKRGSEQSELTGHVTEYFINEVPKTLAEFDTYVKYNILSDDEQKILSNPLYFNTVMKWEDRRKVLISLAGEISENEIIDSFKNEFFKECIKELIGSKKSLSDFKKEYSAKRKLIKEELDTIPTRIDEANNSMPESKDFDLIEQKIKMEQEVLEKIEEQILSKSKFNQEKQQLVIDAQNEKFKKQQRLDELKRESKSKANKSLNELRDKITYQEKIYWEKKAEVTESKRNIDTYTHFLDGYKKELELINQKRNELVKKFEEVSISEFKGLDSSLLSCPTCKRDFEVGKVEETERIAKDKFEAEKTERLAEINKSGANIKAERIELESNIQSYEVKLKVENESYLKICQELEVITKKGAELRDELKLKESNLTVDKTQEEINLEKEIESFVIPSVELSNNDNELKIIKKEIQFKIDTLKLELQDKSIIEKQKARIKELEEKQVNLANEIASFEKYEMAIDDYGKNLIDLVEKKVNDKFKIVKFKMFENQLNGGVKEICECTVNGVKINDVNNAMRINAGIDVINTLSEFYGANSPIFIDNRESVTDLIYTDSQVVNLVVDDNCEKLEVR